MKNSNLIFLAIAGAVGYWIYKSVKPAEAAKTAGGSGTFGTANRILGGVSGGAATIPSVYGFRIPTNGILTGGGSGPGKGAAGLNASVDVSKLVNAAGSGISSAWNWLFGGKASGGLAPNASDQDGTITKERNYQIAKAEAQSAGIGSGFDRFNIPVDFRNPDAGREAFFYTPPAQGPAPAGRSFALDTGEDTVANYTTIPEQSGGWTSVYDGEEYGSAPNDNY